jgi:hypothetical protein
MNEKPPNTFEEGPESIPTPEEVQLIFEQLIEDGEYKDVRKIEDEQGLYLWDIIVSEKDGDIEYSYMREGQYSEGQASATAIHITFFDKEGIPTGGHSVAKYLEGEWKLTP